MRYLVWVAGHCPQSRWKGKKDASKRINTYLQGWDQHGAIQQQRQLPGLSIPREIAQHDRSNWASIPAELSTLAAVVEHCGKM